jgi:ribosome-binding protein aMBF1 (putative translation factor)
LPVRWRFQSRRDILGKSKEGKIAKAFRLHKEGMSIKDIAEKLKIKENVARN